MIRSTQAGHVWRQRPSAPGQTVIDFLMTPHNLTDRPIADKKNGKPQEIKQKFAKST